MSLTYILVSEEPGFHLKNDIVRGVVGLQAGSQKVRVKRPLASGGLVVMIGPVVQSGSTNGLMGQPPPCIVAVGC